MTVNPSNPPEVEQAAVSLIQAALCYLTCSQLDNRNKADCAENLNAAVDRMLEVLDSGEIGAPHDN